MVRIAALIGEDFEDIEYSKPVEAFSAAGYTIINVGVTQGEEVQGKQRRASVTVQQTAGRATTSDFDALFIPGGYSPDHLRVNEDVLKFVRDFVNSGKPMFVICHGPQLLISAGMLHGRVLTGWKSIAVDIRNAGGTYRDQPVVIDGSLITSRGPRDIPAFIKASLSMISDVYGRQPAAIHR